MKAFLVFAVLFIAAVAAEEDFCYDKVVKACDSVSGAKDIQCNPQYGAIEHVLGSLQTFANTHITRSYEYLLMSTHYGDYEMNRVGFQKLLRGLSDAKWNDAIKLIKHITKRGGAMDFNRRKSRGATNYELYEIEVLARAFDMEKGLAEDSNSIHKQASGRSDSLHDPELAHYIEEEFSEKQAGLIRALSGYTTDLAGFLKDEDRSLAFFMFDEYLQKQELKM